jgi:hypothetical protein
MKLCGGWCCDDVRSCLDSAQHGLSGTARVARNDQHRDRWDLAPHAKDEGRGRCVVTVVRWEYERAGPCRDHGRQEGEAVVDELDRRYPGGGFLK